MGDRSEKTIRCLAPAKINLALHVTGQRDDGYHLLETPVAFADFGDQVSIFIQSSNADPHISCSFGGPYGEKLSHALAEDDNHLILRAARAFSSEIANLPKGLTIHLDKFLPLASGIGGGSADAAAVLLTLAKLCGGVPLPSVISIAQKLGADVPMCLHSRGLIASEIGNQIEISPSMPALHLLLVNPGIEISTPEIFKNMRIKDNPPLSPNPKFSDTNAFVEWLKEQRNDLEPAAISAAPEIRIVLDELAGSGAQLARMSGSGATCFSIYENETASLIASNAISKNHPDWWVRTTTTKHHGENRAECVNQASE